MAIIITFTDNEGLIAIHKSTILIGPESIPEILERSLISPDSFIGKTFIREMEIKNRASETKELARNMGPIKLEVTQNGYTLVNSIYILNQSKPFLINPFTQKLIIEFIPN